MEPPRLSLSEFTLLAVVSLALTACDRRGANSGQSDWPPQKSESGFIGACYYPWYYESRWTREPVTHHPQLGHYRSNDKKVAKQHIEWAKQADIDFFLISWVYPGGKEDNSLKRTVLPELEKARYHFGLLYETPIALGFPAGSRLDLTRTLPNATKAGNLLIEHFDYLAANYFSKESYLKFEGRPVVVMYVVRDMTNAAPFLKIVRQRMRKRGIDLFLIADVVHWKNPPAAMDWDFLKQNFQAITGYNMFDDPVPGGDKFLEAVRDEFRLADQLAGGNGLQLIPNVMPGYDDTALRGSHRATMGRKGGQFYRDYWSMVSEFVDAKQPFLLITSFNEWHEGTELEPSIEYGKSYLELTRELAIPLRSKIHNSTETNVTAGTNKRLSTH